MFAFPLRNKHPKDMVWMLRSAIRSFAESQGFEPIGVERDGGVSGAKKLSERDGFRRVLELAEAHFYSTLLVWKFDRLARNLSTASRR